METVLNLKIYILENLLIYSIHLMPIGFMLKCLSLVNMEINLLVMIYYIVIYFLNITFCEFLTLYLPKHLINYFQ